MNRNRMNLRMFENDVNIIDRSGAESLIPTQESNEIIQGPLHSLQYSPEDENWRT